MKYKIRYGKLDFSLDGDERDPITKFHVKSGSFYESDLLEALLKLLPFFADGTIVDCGANIGNHTVFLASQCPDRKVFSFEPNPETFSYLTENVKANTLTNVSCFNLGVGKAKGVYEIVENSENKLGGVSLRKSGSGSCTVTPLDQMSSDFGRIALIKVDVEGMELDVIKGARNILERSRPMLSLETKDADDLLRLRSELDRYDMAPIGVYGDAPTTIFIPSEVRRSFGADVVSEFVDQMVNRCVSDYRG